MHGFRGDTDEFGVAERLSGRLISCRDLMTSAVAVVCASYGVHVEGHERDKDEADKPLAFRPFTSDVKLNGGSSTTSLIDCNIARYYSVQVNNFLI